MPERARHEGRRGAAAQQQDFSAVKIETTKVADNVYMLTGSGGNIGESATAVDVSGVANALPMAMYQSYRYDNATFTFPGLTPRYMLASRADFISR